MSAKLLFLLRKMHYGTIFMNPKYGPSGALAAGRKLAYIGLL
jgi:hypothetical protein